MQLCYDTWVRARPFLGTINCIEKRQGRRLHPTNFFAFFSCLPHRFDGWTMSRNRDKNHVKKSKKSIMVGFLLSSQKKLTKDHTTLMSEEFVIATLPLYLCGKVVHGFNRGSTQLGFPTGTKCFWHFDLISRANIDPIAFKGKLSVKESGVYYGFSKLENESVQPMVMSIGTNPHFGNSETTVVCSGQTSFLLIISGSSRPERLPRESILRPRNASLCSGLHSNDGEIWGSR